MDQKTFLAAVTDPSTWSSLTTDFADGGKRVACYQEGKDSVYAVTDTASVIRPLWLLTMARSTSKALKKVPVTTNYAADLKQRSASETGIMQLTLDGMPELSKPAKLGLTQPPGGNVYKISLTDRLTSALADKYKVPSDRTVIVDDIQSCSASVKTDAGAYAAAGTRTVHRLYLAAAYILLHKKHSEKSKDGVVAIVVDKTGNIVSWGMKNPLVSCWHGETSALMRLRGTLLPGGCVFSTLKPCKMCAGLIFDASTGKTKAFYGQEDAGKDAASTKLDTEHLGAALDAHKSHNLPHGLVVTSDKKPVGQTLQTNFLNQQKDGIGSPIDYVTSASAKDLMTATEQALKDKITKYKSTTAALNPNTKRAVEYLVAFLQLQGINMG